MTEDAEFEKLLSTFIGAAREHLEFEETRVWPELRTARNTERAAELGSQIADRKKTAPTWPYPHASLAGRPQGGRACRRCAGQGTRRGDRPGQRLTRSRPDRGGERALENKDNGHEPLARIASIYRVNPDGTIEALESASVEATEVATMFVTLEGIVMVIRPATRRRPG
jgi:hypothetical protein